MSQGIGERSSWEPTEPVATEVAENLRAQIRAAKAKAQAYREGLEATGKLTPRLGDEEPSAG